MSKATTPAIRISLNKEVRESLARARKLYPALSDAEIFKVGLSNVAKSADTTGDEKEKREIMAAAANSVGADYLSDPKEDAFVDEIIQNLKNE